MPMEVSKNFLEVFEMFITSQTAKGVADITIRNYRYNMKNMVKYFDAEQPFNDIHKRDIEAMIVAMRKAGLAHNTIATYNRMLKTFYNWCNVENLSSLTIATIKEKETVKETYTDEELRWLLQRPEKGCDFGEFRSWVVVNFLLNCGCRAATVRNIQNKDVDLENHQVVFRHTKNGKIQVSPLCSQMASILADYMAVRRGKPEDYLFCNQYGEMLTENALRLAVAHYNKSRGVQKTSLHLFRHTFAKKYLIDCGGNAFTLQRLLGHSTLTMSKRYCNIYDTDIARDYDTYSPLAKMSQKKEKIRRA